MGGFYNINIQDCYAAAAMGVPVQPGLAMPPAYPYPYANVRVKSHDTYEGHGHKHQRHPSFFHKLLLLAGGVTIIGAIMAMGGKSDAARSAASTIKTKAWWKPNTWQSRLAVWNPARVRTSSHVPGRTAQGYGPRAMWHRVDSFNRGKQVYGRGVYTGVGPGSPAYPRSSGPFPSARSGWQRLRSRFNLP